jgi:hypothetical protein
MYVSPASSNLLFMVPYILLTYTYVQFKVQLDVLFMYFLFFSILSFTCFGCYLHPSLGAQLRRTAIGVCMVLVCWSTGAPENVALRIKKNKEYIKKYI